MTLDISAQNIRGILLDIEGTTTPIAFVYDVLFPFARAHVRDYLAKHLDAVAVRADIAMLSVEHTSDEALNLLPPALIYDPSDAEIDSITAYVQWLMDRDRKSTGLKSLQGKIWEQGYRDGTLTSQVFTDVPAALACWQRVGLRVSIFSSGSVLAQKLLFAHTDAGDLTKFLDSYFDTTTGAKTVAESYRRIAAGLQLSPAEIVFISDVAAELDASSSVGMQSVLCIRPGNHPQPATGKQPRIRSFDEVVG